MSRVVIIGALPSSIYNFRGELIRSMVAAGHVVTAMACGATADEIAHIEATGADYCDYKVQRSGLNPLVDLSTVLSLRAAFREIEPDVVLAYTIKPVVWGGLAARIRPAMRFYALVTGLGFALNGHGLARRLLTRLVTRLYRVAIRSARVVIFQNRDNAALFVDSRIVEASKCAVVAGSGVDLTQYTQAPLPSGDVVFLMMSRLLGEKGLREYAKAASIVKKVHPEVQFWHVGAEDPSPDGIPLHEVRDWHERGWIVHHGPQGDVRPFLERCAVFVLPSYHEGMPRSVLEALAVGRPIITTDVPGCRETVVSNENGFLVPSRDADALAERMLWFVDNPSRWQTMSDRSRALAEEYFDVRRVNHDLLRIMEL